MNDPEASLRFIQRRDRYFPKDNICPFLCPKVGKKQVKRH